MSSIKDMKDKYMKNRKVTFSCNWCGHVFRHVEPRSSSGGKRNTVMDQVVCPRCSNFLSPKSYK